MRKILGFVCLAVMFLSSCSKEEMEILGEGTGKLVLNSLEVSASVSDMMSRAVLEENVPSSDDFTITIKSEESSFEKTLDKGVFECILPVGSYTVEAAYGEDVISTDVPYFYGEESVKIEEGAVEPVSVTASLQSAIIHPEMNEELLAQYSEYSLSVSDGESMMNVQNNADVFVPVGKNVTLWLSGTNKLGKPASSKWELNELIPKTRYVISCDADLPSFTFPTQPETNAWSKFMYITPMTSENMSSHSEMVEQVMANIVYEASADGATWLPATYDAAKEKWVIKDLQPNTPYTVRSRFGGVVSTNTQMLTTENAQELVNGNMEEWTSTELYSGNGSFSAKVYCDYCTGWSTRNEKTTDGSKNASGGIGGFFPINSNYGAAWRWHSGTVKSTDKNGGENAAELSTLAFYNQKLNGAYDRNEIHNLVKDDGIAYVAYLFLGVYNLSSDSYSLGIEHLSRPVSVSFDYKYIPVEGDQCIAYAKLYDKNKKEIASTIEFHSNGINVYTTQELDFVYSDLTCKANYIGVFFQSGTDLDISKMRQEEGSYNMSPFNQDRIVGSVLKIDNVKLNYEYE